MSQSRKVGKKGGAKKAGAKSSAKGDPGRKDSAADDAAESGATARKAKPPKLKPELPAPSNADAGLDAAPSEVDASADFVHRVAAVLAAAGFPRMPATVLATLLGSSAVGLTAEQLGERAGASAAAISGAVRYLETVGMVRRRREPGQRRYLWELVDDGWYTASLRKPPVYDELARISVAELAHLAPDSLAHERIAEMADFMAYVREALPRVLDEWHALRASGRR